MENLFIVGDYSMLSESSAPFAAPESLQRDPVVRVKMRLSECKRPNLTV